MRRHWRAFVVFSGLLAAGVGPALAGRAAGPSAPPGGPVATRGEVRDADFLKTGRKLVIGVVRDQRPLPLAYYLLYRGRYHIVADANDLVGQVDIRSNKQALIYARIIPPPEQWHEVFPVSQAAHLFPGRSLQEIRRLVVQSDAPGEVRQRFYGVLTDEEWKANGLSGPTVGTSRGRFVVKRWVYPAVGPCTTVLQLSEVVSRDGRLERQVAKRKRLVGVEFYTGGIG